MINLAVDALQLELPFADTGQVSGGGNPRLITYVQLMREEKDSSVLSIFQTLEKSHKAFLNPHIWNTICDAAIILHPTKL